MRCRFCNNLLTHEFIDLVNSPPSNSFLDERDLNEPEVTYPLKLYVCDKCFLVQIDEYKKHKEIFNQDYVYFSSFSRTWVAHSERYVDIIVPKLNLDKNSFVVEIASNDGYLLQFFKKRGIPCLGIEPTTNTAHVARQKGIEVIERFFNSSLANDLVLADRCADLIIGNNVFAHDPNINDFVDGLRIALKPSGTITLEFPHLLQLIEQTQFDTIYHEHFSYYSFAMVDTIFRSKGLTIYDVEELPTHGGSLRIYTKHAYNKGIEVSPNVQSLISEEKEHGMFDMSYYQSFQSKVDNIKYDLLEFLINQKRQGKKVAAYGAAAKGNTLLNYCGVKKDLIDYVVDISPYKQGKYLPGSHIPVVGEEEIKKRKPNYVLILPWNIKEEIMAQLDYIRTWEGKFVVPIPYVGVIS